MADANLQNGNYSDQRGYPRVRGAAADIGSVETGSEISIFTDGFEWRCFCR